MSRIVAMPLRSLLTTVAMLSFSTVSSLRAQDDSQDIAFVPAYSVVNVAALVDAFKEGVDIETVAALLGKPRQGNEFDIRKAVKEQLDFIQSEAKIAKKLGLMIDYRKNKNNPLISEFDFDKNQFYVCFPDFYRTALIDDWGRTAVWKVSGLRELLPEGRLGDFGCPYAVDQEGLSGSATDSRIDTLAIPISFDDLSVAEHFSKLEKVNFFSTTYCVPDWTHEKTELRRYEIQCEATKIELTYVGSDGSWNKVLEYTRQGGSWVGELNKELILSLQ